MMASTTSSSTDTASLYKGNSIFRNQPSYTHFNKSFEDETDALFLGLNEINPLFLKPEIEKHNAILFDTQLVVDPRNKQLVIEYLIDHTKPRYPTIFRSPHISKLTKGQHVISVRLLQAWQNRDEVDDNDLLTFRRFSRKRDSEKIEFLKYVNEYCLAKREKIYAPTKQLVELYNMWYRRRACLLMSQKENISYNTQSGLPDLKSCANNDQTVELVNVEILKRFGHISVWRGAEKAINSKLFKNKLQTFAAMFVDATEEYEKFTEANYNNVFNDQKKEDNGMPSIFMPLESLLFLCTAGDYADLPTEMLVNIEDGELRFHAPLPSRNCGWHTYRKVVIQSLQAYQSTSSNVLWLDLAEQGKMSQSPKDNIDVKPELNETFDYKPQLLEDYIKKMPHIFKNSGSRVKFNESLVAWQLCDKSTLEKLQFFTTLPQPPATDVDGAEYLGGVSIKLEYKPEFGCEIMTKYELLEEYFTTQLLTTHKEEFLHRIRLSADSFEIQVTEKLVAAQIEAQLLETYSVRISRLLSGLFCFLKLLQNMPNGQYMLRYNPKFRDKMMLCAPSQEITQRTIFLHSLLQAEPSDLVFMTQQHVLPIADSVCSIVHSFHRVLPCMFKPDLNEENISMLKKGKAVTKCVNDSDFVRTRMEKKTEAIINKEKAQARRHKGAQKVRRRARRRAEKAELTERQSEEAELQREIELDKKLFGLN